MNELLNDKDKEMYSDFNDIAECSDSDDVLDALELEAEQ